MCASRHWELMTPGERAAQPQPALPETPLSTYTYHPSLCRPFCYPSPSGPASHKPLSLLTCKQATVPSPKFKVPTTSSPSLYTDLKMPNVPTFPRPSLILYRSGETGHCKPGVHTGECLELGARSQKVGLFFIIWVRYQWILEACGS